MFLVDTNGITKRRFKQDAPVQKPGWYKTMKEAEAAISKEARKKEEEEARKKEEEERKRKKEEARLLAEANSGNN